MIKNLMITKEKRKNKILRRKAGQNSSSYPISILVITAISIFILVALSACSGKSQDGLQDSLEERVTDEKGVVGIEDITKEATEESLEKHGPEEQPGEKSGGQTGAGSAEQPGGEQGELPERKGSTEEVKDMALKLKSIGFENNKEIPSKYSCEGEDINPSLSIEGVPEDTKTLALIMDDPDAPAGTWVHWVMWNIPVTDTINENSAPGTEGKNSWGKHGWGGPCPPSGTHRYVFKLYALDTELELSTDSGKEELLQAMEGHILDQTELIGKYSKG